MAQSSLSATPSPSDPHRLQARWRREPSNSSRRRYRLCVLAGGLGLALLTAGLAWAATWLQPPRPASLVLIGAGYEDNLALPENHFAWEGLRHLAQLSQESSSLSFWGQKLLELKHEPTRLRTDTRWDQCLDGLDERTVVLVMAVHGGADAQGAYLLPQDATTTKENVNRLKLTDVLDKLAQLPVNKKKVLVLDSTGMRVSWELGMLENAFVRELRELEPTIAAIPNCVVLCASDHSQRSWDSADYNSTIYLHFLAEGLRGGATDLNRDGRINLWELHQFTSTKVHQWVSRNRSAQQTPILLPASAEGARRAKEIDLCIHRSTYTPSPLLNVSLPADELRELWQAYQALEHSTPKPNVYSPQLWRRYQLATLRCEELLCAGDSNNAARLRNLMRDITIEIERNQELKLCSLPNTLTMQYVAGSTPVSPTAGRDVLQNLWTADPQKYTGIWEKAKSASPQPQLLQLSLYEQLIQRAAEDPANNLATACKLFEIVHDPLHCGPAEMHLLVMLNRDLPPWTRQPSGNELVAMALQVRLLAEQAASAVPTEGYAYTEEVYPWIKWEIEQADRQRRLGEDLLFADASQQSTAMTYFQQARHGYTQAMNAAGRVRTALALRDEVLSQLPYYSHWLAHHVSDNLIRPGDETLISGLQSLWKETHTLTNQLQQPNRDWIAEAPPASQRVPTPRSLVDQTNVVRQNYTFLEARLIQRWDELTRIELAEACPDVASALRVPFDDIEMRLKLRSHMQRVSRRFAMDQTTPEGSEHAEIAPQVSPSSTPKASTLTQASTNASGAKHANSALTKSPQQPPPSNGQPENAKPIASQAVAASPVSASPVPLNQPETPLSYADDNEEEIALTMTLASADMTDLSANEILRQTKSAARWQGQVALAALGEFWFNECPGENLETFEQVQHRLTVFSVEENWWQTLMAAGDQIGKRWNAMPGTIHNWIETSARQEDAQAVESLQQAAGLARFVCLGGPKSFGDDASGTYRRIRLQQFLLASANRTYLDHWYALDPNAEPYYVTAGLVYLNDASRMSTHTASIDPLRQQITTPSSLVVRSPSTLQITSEPRFQVRYELSLPDVPAESLGFPVCWFTAESPLTLIQPEPQQRVCQQPTHTKAPSAVTAVVDNPQLLVTEADTSGTAPIEHSELTLFALYRGQQITSETPVLLNTTPEIVRVQLPTPANANLAVRADPQLQAAFGSGSGAMAIVLDCSGSMGPKSGDPFTPTTKFVEATTALERVLSHVPPGTQVSVWVFGQAMGPGKTVTQAEDTIRQVQPPVIWNPQDSQQLEQLMAKVSHPAIEPWNESPIVRAMLAAKNDLTEVTGFKTLLVITDGMDNRFANDPQTNPTKQDIPAALVTAFQNSGITVNVVGFKVVGGEQAEAKRQFSAVERLFPPGHFYQVDQAASLASVLDSAMEQRLRYWIEDFQDRRLSLVPADGLDVGQSGAGDHWLPKGISAGNYQVSAQGQEPARMPIALDPGDKLLMRIAQQSGALHFQRLLYSQTDYGWKPWRKYGDWRFTILQNQRLQDNAAQLLVALEQIPVNNESYLRLAKPQEVWLEVQPRNDQPCSSIRWGYCSDYPAPTYSVDLKGWPRDARQTDPERPLVKVWWSPDQPAPPAVSLARSRDFHTLEELAGQQIQALTAAIRIDQVAVETHVVEVKPGVREQRSCLAVRLTLPPEQSYWARPQGLEIAGAEHRYYEHSTRYTGLFWPVTADEAAKVLTGLNLISLSEFKSEAERRGFLGVMDTLPAPSPDDARPRPPVGN